MNQYLGCPLLDHFIRTTENKDMRTMAQNAVRFRVDNVAEYWDMTTKDQHKTIQDMAPNAAPVGDSCWFEWTYDDGISLGILMTVIEDRKVEPEPFTRARTPSIRWVLGCWMTIRLVGEDTRIGKLTGQGANTANLPVGLAVVVHEDGQIDDAVPIGYLPSLELGEREKKLMEDSERLGSMMDERALLSHIGPALLAVSFAHCKNVERREVRPQTRQIQRQLERTKATTTYKVLEIDPMRQVLQTEGDISKNGLKTALHICRGHFAVYTADRPLFGHYVGMVYHKQHTRGTLKKGQVIKGYNVKAPKVGAEV